MPLGANKIGSNTCEFLELGHWTQTAAVNGGNGSSARFVYTGSGESDTHSYTYSCWWKASSSDWDTDNDSTDCMKISASAGAGLDINIHKTNGITATVTRNSSAGGVSISTGSTPRGASFASTYIDDNWHHMFVQVRFNSGQLGQSRIFLDGEDCTFNGRSTTAPAADNADDQIDFWGTGGATKEFGGDIAQLWLDIGTTTDYLGCSTTPITGASTQFPCVITSPNHGRSNGDRVVIDGISDLDGTTGSTASHPIADVLNGLVVTVQNATTNTFECKGVNTSGNTDEWHSGGYVSSIGADTNIHKWINAQGEPRNLGNTGTPEGLSQPDVFLYVNTLGNLVNGGSQSGTLSEQGSGLTKSATGGPQYWGAVGSKP